MALRLFTSSSGVQTRLGGAVISGQMSGQIVTLGSILGDFVINGGMKGGRIVAQGGIVGNMTINGVTHSVSEAFTFNSQTLAVSLSGGAPVVFDLGTFDVTVRYSRPD